MAQITLEGISKTYDGNVAAVRDLHLQIEDGEFLVLVGESGSGKSTALRVIAGLERASTGQVRIDGRDVTDRPPQERDLAMVFQSYALYPHLTVRENLAFPLEMRKLPRAEVRRRVDDVAASLGLAQLLARKPAALSGGQRQRVALGRAIVREPRAFLFDEPLSNLDARLRVQTRAELIRLHRELGATMVYVTHDQVEAMTMGQRIALLQDGRLQQLAPPLELYHEPANRTVAAFIGSPPMNFLSGRIERAAGDVHFAAADARVHLPRDPGHPEVVLGIRPEHLHPCSDADADLRVRINLVESLGSESLAYGTTEGGTGVACRLPGMTSVRVEDVLPLRLERDRIHFFHPSTGVRL